MGKTGQSNTFRSHPPPYRPWAQDKTLSDWDEFRCGGLHSEADVRTDWVGRLLSLTVTRLCKNAGSEIGAARRCGCYRRRIRRGRIVTNMTCRVQGCANEAAVRGLCSMHYMRAAPGRCGASCRSCSPAISGSEHRTYHRAHVTATPTLMGSGSVAHCQSGRFSDETIPRTHARGSSQPNEPGFSVRSPHHRRAGELVSSKPCCEAGCDSVGMSGA